MNLNNFKTWLTNRSNSLRDWWHNNRYNVIYAFDSFVRGIDRIAANILRLMIIGVIINVVASHFYPEFPERFPVIYGWFDGWLQFGEFLFKTALGGIYSFFTGNWNEFLPECQAEIEVLCKQFLNWLSTLTF